MLYDSDEDPDYDGANGRISIFGTSKNLVQLFRCKVWYVDGTFKSAPSIFYQLFSVLGAVTQTGVNRKPQTVGLPFVWALLERKTRAVYEKVFNIILEEGRKLGSIILPGRIMIDFELPSIQAAEAVFGKNIVKCCLFHLCQSVYRHVVDEGLKTLYNDKEDRRIKIATHMLCG